MSAAEKARAMLADGVPQREISRVTGVPRSTLYGWAKDVPKPAPATRKRISHYVVPDCQIRPGDVTDYLVWIARDIVKRKPDVIVCIGDFFDMPSLSSYSAAGGAEKELSRISADLAAGHAAMKRLTDPIHREIARTKRSGHAWTPRMVFTFGNHENRLDRVWQNDARFIGVIGTHLCEVEKYGFERVPFEVPIEIDGLWYCHYWKSASSPRPIAGTVDNRLNKLGFSFVCGHVQDLLYSRRPLPNGRTLHGIVAGSCYLGTELYRGPQSRNEWRGTIAIYDVHDGSMAPVFLDLPYHCRTYAKEELPDYLAKRYPDRDWSYLPQ